MIINHKGVWHSGYCVGLRNRRSRVRSSPRSFFLDYYYYLRGKNGEKVRNRGQFWKKGTQSWFSSKIPIASSPSVRYFERKKRRSSESNARENETFFLHPISFSSNQLVASSILASLILFFGREGARASRKTTGINKLIII
jgi:hypothetical protein